MQRFKTVIGIVASTPVIEMESPFYLSFDLNIAGDIVPATFIGNHARALQKQIRVGDKVQPRDGLIDNGKLVFDLMYMEPSSAVGRNIDTWVV